MMIIIYLEANYELFYRYFAIKESRPAISEVEELKLAKLLMLGWQHDESWRPTFESVCEELTDT